MRKAAIVLLACLAPVAFAQAPQGNYRASTGEPQPWSINDNHTLIWAGQPYLPIGLHIDGSPASILAAHGAGVNDVIVDLPANGAGWSEATSALEASQMRYMVNINSLAPMAKGFRIEPQGYRVTGITKARHLSYVIPDATTALAILVTRRDNDVQQVVRVKIVDEKFELDVKPRNDLDHVLYIYPESRSLEQPDCWEAMDEHRDRLLTSLKKSPFGRGMRGLINPMGALVNLPSAVPTFVPSSIYFQYELRVYLESKYKNLETAQRAWSMNISDIEKFDQMSRLVPLWSAEKSGVPTLWDPATDKLYPCNPRQSTVWRDIRDVLLTASLRRYSRLTAAIRPTLDAPILQDWAGWTPIYEGQKPPVDGMGFASHGTNATALAESGGRAASTVFRWLKSGLLLTTRADVSGEKDAITQLPNAIEDLVALGSRGVYFSNATADVMKAVASIATKTPLDPTVATYSPQALFFPENALNPAVIQRLPAGNWWLPTPANGNRIDLGSSFFGYRLEDAQHSSTVLWTNLPKGRYKLRLLNPKSVSFASVDGSDPAPKIYKGGIEVTLSQYPLIITGGNEIPIPELALTECLARFAALLDSVDPEHRGLTEERYLFAQGSAGFERNPGGSFFVMRQEYLRLASRVAPFSWIEAESTKDQTFSEVSSMPGCSGGQALSVRSSLEGTDLYYTATYPVQVRTAEDQTVWVAAKLPPDRRGDLLVLVGGQSLQIEAGPFSPYGAGFAWYRLGSTKLGGQTTKVSIQIQSRTGADVAVDTLLLTPLEFRPNGTTMPDPIDFSRVKKQ